MVIIGAGGFAKELLEVVTQTIPMDHIAFYDDVTANGPHKVFEKFPILKNEKALLNHFEHFGTEYTLGLGGSRQRHLFYNKINALGGNLISTIDQRATVGTFCQVGLGCNILSQACISNSSQIGKAALIYYNSIITHDSVLGDFVEVSPNATLLGRCSIGDYTHIGACSTILSNVKIGRNCLIGAGAVVTKDVPDNAVIKGVPAEIIRYQSS